MSNFENAAQSALNELRDQRRQLVAALKAVRHEVKGTHPHSTDSYLPPEIVALIDAALAAAEN